MTEKPPRLTPEEILLLKEVAAQRRALTWVGKWTQTVFLVVVGGLVSMFTLFELWRNTR